MLAVLVLQKPLFVKTEYLRGLINSCTYRGFGLLKLQNSSVGLMLALFLCLLLPVESAETVAEVYSASFDRAFVTLLVVGTVIQLFLILKLIRALAARKNAELSLVESEMKYRRLAQNSPAVVFQFKMTPDGNFSFPFVNETLFAIIGIRPEDAMRDANVVLSRISNDERAKFRDAVLESAKALTPFHCVFRYDRPERVGIINWIEARSTPSRLPDGSTIWDGFLFDITEEKETEAALKAKTAELEAYFASSLDMLVISDLQGNMLRLNHEWENFLGCSFSELNEKKMLTFVHPDDQPATRQIIDKLAHEDKISGFVNRLKRKDGVYRYIEWSSRRNGLFVYSASRDVTEQKLAIEALKESGIRAGRQRSALARIMIDESVVAGDTEKATKHITRLLTETLEVARASIWVLSADQSDLVCQTLYDSGSKKYSNGAILKTATFPSYFAAIVAENRVYADDVLTDPRTVELVAGYLKPLHIVSLLDAGIFIGGKLYGVISCEHTGQQRSWQPDEESFISSMASLVGQIWVTAERRKAQDALRDSEARLNSILNVIPDMVSVHDQEMNIVYSNWKGFANVPEQLRVIGTKCHKTYRNNEEICPDCRARSVLDTGLPCIAEALLPDGKWVEVRCLPIHDANGNGRLFVEWVRDITGLKHNERIISAKNRELEQILYVASHDLRSPLVNVDGYSRELEYNLSRLQDLLEKGASVDNSISGYRQTFSDMNDDLNHIRKSAKQMDLLIKGLLKLSRLGRAALNLTTLDMNRLVQDSISTVDFEKQKNGVEIKVDSLPTCIGDQVQVTQVFINLLSNAIKYLDDARPGKIVISGETEKGRSIYCVEDNGIGIDKAYQEIIFELFHRLDPAKKNGEGLGLTIVRQILAMLDGDINVESTPGVGSRFYVSLPSSGVFINEN